MRSKRLVIFLICLVALILTLTAAAYIGNLYSASKPFEAVYEFDGTVVHIYQRSNTEYILYLKEGLFDSSGNLDMVYVDTTLTHISGEVDGITIQDVLENCMTDVTLVVTTDQARSNIIENYLLYPATHVVLTGFTD